MGADKWVEPCKGRSMSQPRVLIVEDDSAQQLLLIKALGASFELVIASSFQEGLDSIQNDVFDLYILDIMLDESDGFALCAAIRADDRLDGRPVIFLTSKPEIESKVKGFELGADDYLVKPVDPMELRARVDSKIRRSQEVEVRDSVEVVGGLILHLDLHSVEWEDQFGRQRVELTPLEFKLFYLLARHDGVAFTREDILTQVWGNATHVLNRSVDTYVTLIRKKLGPKGKWLRAVRGVGYRFEVPPEAQRKAG